MEPLPTPKTVKIYQLIKQSGMSFTCDRAMSSNSIGTGFFLTREEAEHNRTLAILADTTVGRKPSWYIFELEVPNPAYTE
jgi:hypothetical protein